MKKILTILLLTTAISSFARIECSGNGIHIKISDPPLHAEIDQNGKMIADTTDVSDISAFEIHYIGNFGRSSFDLVVHDNNQATLSFDNYPLRSITLNCQ